MSTIRISQTLREGYNPDGTPGTVSTGVAGIAGRAPTTEEIAAAVGDYLEVHPITVEAAGASKSEYNRFGSGSDGSPGSYVDIGSHGGLHGYVTADGTPATVNLYLEAPKGDIVSTTEHVFLSTLTAQGGITVRGSNGVDYDVSTRFLALEEVNGVGAAPDLVAVFEGALQ